MTEPDFTQLPCALADITSIWVLSCDAGRFQVQVRTVHIPGGSGTWTQLVVVDSRADAEQYRDKLTPIVNAARRLVGKDKLS